MLFGGEVGSSSDLNQLFELASLLLSHLNQEAQAQHMDALVAPVVATMHQLLTGTEQVQGVNTRNPHVIVSSLCIFSFSFLPHSHSLHLSLFLP